MKHIQAGLIVGGVLTLAVIVGAVVWAILSTLTDPGAASVIVAILVVVTVATIVIDYATERRT